MDTNIKHIDFDNCVPALKQQMEVSLADNGKLLCISICLKNIWPDRSLIVGVLVCRDGHPYAFQTREVRGCECCSSCCCCCLEDRCIEGFEFIFPNQICKEEITIKVIAHYIC